MESNVIKFLYFLDAFIEMSMENTLFQFLYGVIAVSFIAVIIKMFLPKF